VAVEYVVDELQWQYQQQFLNGGVTGHDVYQLAPLEWSELLKSVPAE